MSSLKRTIGIPGATLIGLASMIGTGVFAAWSLVVTSWVCRRRECPWHDPWQAWGFSFRPDQSHVRSSCGPGAPAIDGDDDHRPRRRLRLVVRVLRDQSNHPRSTLSRPNRHEPRPPVHSDPPQCGPVLLIVVDEQAHPRVRLDVCQPPQRPRRLWLRVHCGPDRVPHHSKDNRHEVRATARRHRGEPRHPPRREPLTRPVLHAPNGMPGGRTSHRGRWASSLMPDHARRGTRRRGDQRVLSPGDPSRGR